MDQTKPSSLSATASSSGKSTTSLLDIKLEKTKQGTLGNFFGSSWSMLGYISALCLIMSVVCFIFIVIFNSDSRYASYPTALLTLAGGLLAGKKLK